jgi:hypothetical protein
VQAATKVLSAHGPFQIETARYTARNPHPGGQEAFIASVKFTWCPSPLYRSKIESTHDKAVLLEAKRRNLIRSYQEDMAASLRGYPLLPMLMARAQSLPERQR